MLLPTPYTRPRPGGRTQTHAPKGAQRAGRYLSGVGTGNSGPADPGTSAVAQEPYSTSDPKGIALVIATNTKICSEDGSAGNLGPRFSPAPAPPYSYGPEAPRRARYGIIIGLAPSIFEAPAFGR